MTTSLVSPVWCPQIDASHSLPDEGDLRAEEPMECPEGEQSTTYLVCALVTKKMLFKTRPKPIVSVEPKA